MDSGNALDLFHQGIITKKVHYHMFFEENINILEEVHLYGVNRV